MEIQIYTTFMQAGIRVWERDNYLYLFPLQVVKKIYRHIHISMLYT